MYHVKPPVVIGFGGLAATGFASLFWAEVALVSLVAGLVLLRLAGIGRRRGRAEE